MKFIENTCRLLYWWSPTDAAKIKQFRHQVSGYDEKCTTAECAAKDTIWGTGLYLKDPDRFDITKWKGQNLLDFFLTTVRKDI